jgi:hypothetical protein
MEHLPAEIQTVIISYIPYTTCRVVCLKWKSMIDNHKVKTSFSDPPERAYFNKEMFKKYVLNYDTHENIGYFIDTETCASFVIATMTWLVRSTCENYNLNQLNRTSGIISTPSVFCPVSVSITLKGVA